MSDARTRREALLEDLERASQGDDIDAIVADREDWWESWWADRGVDLKFGEDGVEILE